MKTAIKLCAHQHWIGHSRITGEDIFRLCELPDRHEGDHRDENGSTWADEHRQESER